MVFTGIPVSGGVAIGEVIRFEPFEPDVSETFFEKESVSKHIEKYRDAKGKTAEKLREIVRELSERDVQKAKIFEAHIDIVFDGAINDDINAGIEKNLWMPDWAVFNVYNKYVDIFKKSKNPVTRERADDLLDVRNRILREIYGFKGGDLTSLGRPLIIAARDLLPSDTATVDRENVLAIITENGGETSHSAIIAKSYSIPAVLGASGLFDAVRDGDTVIVDAISGKVITAPSRAQIEEYETKRSNYLKKSEKSNKFIDKPAVTSDGVKIEIGLNIGSVSDVELDNIKHADFTGLFRTEFLYMEKNSLPSEDEQFDAYRKALAASKGRPLILRTVDIGGDKQLRYMSLPKEENPFLGKRALRLCFDNIPFFKTQLRAALKASAYGDLWLMLPMVSAIDDIRRAKEIINDARKELINENIPYNEAVKIGIMIEIPSIALISDMAAKEVDFASIGTNDLCQYMTAADRLNPGVKDYYRPYHPSMFRLIGYVSREFNKANKPLSVCGEMAGNSLAVPVLVGLGLRKLSMSFGSAAQVKRIISTVSTKEAQEVAQAVCELSCADEVEEYIKDRLGDRL